MTLIDAGLLVEPSLKMSTRFYYSNDKDPLHTFDLHAESNEGIWVIFIHGGAWRDPQQTSHDGDVLMAYLRQTFPTLSLASVNYRLSPVVRHPSHQADVISAIEFLKSMHGMKDFVLVGHSAGGCLAFQCAHLQGCRGLVSAEGIYDLEELVNEYPEYQDFVVEAFGEDKTVWREASPTSLAVTLLDSPRILLVQSTEDELLSRRQTELMSTVLAKSGVDVQPVAWIKGSHDEAIRTDEFCSLVCSFVMSLKGT